MRQMQDEHRLWIAKKYPDQSPEIPAAGCLEEAGELMHAVLKLKQIAIWGEDARHTLAKKRVELVDALGDCVIYACSLCNANSWDFEVLYETAHQELPYSTDLVAATMVMEAAVGVALRSDSHEHLQVYLSRLKMLSNMLGIDLYVAAKTTWLTVKER